MCVYRRTVFYSCLGHPVTVRTATTRHALGTLFWMPANANVTFTFMTMCGHLGYGYQILPTRHLGDNPFSDRQLWYSENRWTDHWPVSPRCNTRLHHPLMAIRVCHLLLRIIKSYTKYGISMKINTLRSQLKLVPTCEIMTFSSSLDNQNYKVTEMCRTLISFLRKATRSSV